MSDTIESLRAELARKQQQLDDSNKQESLLGGWLANVANALTGTVAPCDYGKAVKELRASAEQAEAEAKRWEESCVETEKRLALADHIRAKVEAERDALRAEARRWYLADGSFIELDPAEVIERRKAAAAKLAGHPAGAGEVEAPREALKRVRASPGALMIPGLKAIIDAALAAHPAPSPSPSGTTAQPEALPIDAGRKLVAEAKALYAKYAPLAEGPTTAQSQAQEGARIAALMAKGEAEDVGGPLGYANVIAYRTGIGDVMFGPALRFAAAALEAGADEPFAASPDAIEACAAMLREGAKQADARETVAAARAIYAAAPAQSQAAEAGGREAQEPCPHPHCDGTRHYTVHDEPPSWRDDGRCPQAPPEATTGPLACVWCEQLPHADWCDFDPAKRAAPQAAAAAPSAEKAWERVRLIDAGGMGAKAGAIAEIIGDASDVIPDGVRVRWIEGQGGQEDGVYCRDRFAPLAPAQAAPTPALCPECSQPCERDAYGMVMRHERGGGMACGLGYANVAPAPQPTPAEEP